jgi:hypothetical protein
MSPSETTSTCETWHLSCPRCGEATDSLKRYRVLDYLLFLFVGLAYGASTATACPRCMRRLLLVNTLYNAPLANLLWPVAILPWNLPLFIASYMRGHSQSILELLGQQPAR